MRLAELLAMLAVTSGMAYMVSGYLDLPIVQVDHLTGECVRVLSPDDNYSCDRLPDRYIVQHVRGGTDNGPKDSRGISRIERPSQRSKAESIRQNWIGLDAGSRANPADARSGRRYF